MCGQSKEHCNQQNTDHHCRRVNGNGDDEADAFYDQIDGQPSFPEGNFAPEHLIFSIRLHQRIAQQDIAESGQHNDDAVKPLGKGIVEMIADDFRDIGKERLEKEDGKVVPNDRYGYFFNILPFIVQADPHGSQPEKGKRVSRIAALKRP